MTDLPPLPYPVEVSRRYIGHGLHITNAYTADQMREYALAAIAAEREANAKLCEGLREAADHSSDGLKRAGAMSMAAACARMIRAR